MIRDYLAKIMMRDYLAEIRRFHAAHIEPYTGKPVGSTEAEVAALERQVGFPLPEAYRQYLRFMGKDYNGCFQGSSCFLAHAIPETEELPRLLADNGVRLVLPEHYLVFYGHQGYVAAWFDLPKKAEDPPCYFFTESRGGEPVLKPTLTGFILDDMRGIAQILPRLHPRRRPGQA